MIFVDDHYISSWMEGVLTAFNESNQNYCRICFIPFFAYLFQAQEMMKDYIPGLIENGGKLVLLMSLIEESIKNGDKIIVFR